MPQRAPLTSFQLDSLDLLCRVVAADSDLHRWFTSLRTLPANLRMNAIMQITTDMRRNQEDMHLIGALCSLSDKDVYAAAVEAVGELQD